MASSSANLFTGLLQGIAQGQQLNAQRKQAQEEKDRRDKKDKLERKLLDLDLEDRQITRRRQGEELQLKKDQFKSKQEELGKAALLKEQNRDFLKTRFPNIFGTSAPAPPQQAPLAVPGQSTFPTAPPAQPGPQLPQLGPSAGAPLPAQPPQLGPAPAQQPGQAPVTTFIPNFNSKACVNSKYIRRDF